MRLALLTTLLFVLSLSVQANGVKLKLEWLGYGAVKVIFENRSKESKLFLKPLDGSGSGQYEPKYIFTVWDHKGKKIPYPAHDIPGVFWLGTKWPEDYLITVEPGGSKEMEYAVAQLMDKEEGKFRIRLLYEFIKSKTENDSFSYPDGVWEGTVKSRTIRVKFLERSDEE